MRDKNVERKEDTNGLNPAEHLANPDPDHLNHILIKAIHNIS